MRNGKKLLGVGKERCIDASEGNEKGRRKIIRLGWEPGLGFSRQMAKEMSKEGGFLLGGGGG